VSGCFAVSVMWLYSPVLVVWMVFFEWCSFAPGYVLVASLFGGGVGSILGILPCGEGLVSLRFLECSYSAQLQGVVVP